MGNISVLVGALTVYVDYVNGAIPGPLSPSFLPRLKEAGGLIVKECANCFAAPDTAPPGTTRALTGLPGLASLYRIAPPTNPTAGASLVVENTAFPSFATTFSNLTCTASLVLITGNAALSSLQGLQTLVQAVPPGPTYLVSGSPLLSAAGATQLTALAGCPFPSSTSSLTAAIQLLLQNCVVTVCLPCQDFLHPGYFCSNFLALPTSLFYSPTTLLNPTTSLPLEPVVCALPPHSLVPALRLLRCSSVCFSSHLCTESCG